VIAAAGEGLRHVAWTTPQSAPLTVALLQGNIEQSLKFDPRRYARTLETYARLAEQTRARLIVFPETAVPRFLDGVEPAYLQRLDAIARRNQGDLLLGVPTRSSRDEYFNSVITLGTSPVQVYHKVHLVPFGEFAPPGLAWTLRLVNIPLSDFSSGSARKPLDVAGQRIAVNICYEDAFGDEIAAQLPEATLLVNVSNVAWFGDSLAPAQHLQIAQLRAIETGRMHLTATNTGITAAIDTDGRVLARLPQFAEGRLEITAQGYAGATPYVLWRDWPLVLLCLGVLIAAALVARRKLSR
jgi:apolipoprotein N-acyltransferase